MSISLPGALHRTLRGLLDGLLPHSCLLCGQDADAALCTGCLADLEPLPTPACAICALPTALGEPCGRCLAKRPHFDATLACYTYGYPLDRLLHSLKYMGNLQAAAFFGRALAQLRPAGGDLVLPVPLHRSRLAERGYNQALEIAREPARRWGLPLDPWLVERASRGQNQAGLAWSARRKNVRNAFTLKGEVAGKHVLVVDDVMTTGATLNELARLLKRHGAARVTTCIVARTLTDD